jgi:hypothetical protein
MSGHFILLTGNVYYHKVCVPDVGSSGINEGDVAPILMYTQLIFQEFGKTSTITFVQFWIDSVQAHLQYGSTRTGKEIG